MSLYLSYCNGSPTNVLNKILVRSSLKNARYPKFLCLIGNFINTDMSSRVYICANICYIISFENFFEKIFG